MTTPGPLVARWSVRDRLRPLILLALAAVVVAAVTGALLRIDDATVAVAGLLPFLAVAGVVLFALPVHTLPTLAVGVLALVPTRLIPNDGPFNALPPLAILMGVWVFRRLVLGHRPPDEAEPATEQSLAARLVVSAVAVVLLVWLLLSTALAGGGETPIGWTVAFVTSALLPLLVPDARAEARLLRDALLVIGALVGAYLFVEMLLGFSPLYGGATREFIFSVYRARGAFAHPLFAGAFLTIPAALGIARWLRTGRRWPLVAGGLAAIGVVATVSRGSIGALGVAVGIAVVLSPFLLGWRQVGRWAAFVGLAAVAAVIVLTASPLADRADSIESQLSAGVRERAVDVAGLAGASSGWVGTGPGTSGVTARLFDDIIIENSLLQLLISVGIPGLALFLLFVASLAAAAWVNRNLGAVLAVAAYTVAITGFNSIDAVRSMHVIFGILVILALFGSDDDARMLRPAPRQESLLV